MILTSFATFKFHDGVCAVARNTADAARGWSGRLRPLQTQLATPALASARVCTVLVLVRVAGDVGRCGMSTSPTPLNWRRRRGAMHI